MDLSKRPSIKYVLQGEGEGRRPEKKDIANSVDPDETPHNAASRHMCMYDYVIVQAIERLLIFKYLRGVTKSVDFKKMDNKKLLNLGNSGVVVAGATGGMVAGAAGGWLRGPQVGWLRGPRVGGYGGHGWDG
ncbi:hypothetical protein DPMN_075910 [Dreissena polymorpha]|uniref:Uncharacterized protein n=1 Tax=Dreissena polymorpha TaxID=45954 RepID=A0A9D3YLE0_DREPO|nr:hypothetical protein DPMN_075910 [Dreissena polymorpha]